MIVVAGEALVDVITRRDGSIVTVPGGGPFNTARAIAGSTCPSRGPASCPSTSTGSRWPDRSPPTACRSTSSSAPTCRRRARSRSSTIAARRATGSTSWERRPRRWTRARCSPRSRPASTRCTSARSASYSSRSPATIETLVATLGPDVILIVDPNCRPSAIADPAGLPRADRPHPRPRGHRQAQHGRPGLPGGRRHGPFVVVTDAGGPVRIRVGDRATRSPCRRGRCQGHRGGGRHVRRRDARRLVDSGITRSTIADRDAVLTAVRFAVRASSIVCQRAGADPPTLAELGGW